MAVETPMVTKFLRERPDDSWQYETARAYNNAYTRIEKAFAMGSEDFYPEERPVHEVGVDGFWMDTHQVTVAEFLRFRKKHEYHEAGAPTAVATPVPNASTKNESSG